MDVAGDHPSRIALVLVRSRKNFRKQILREEKAGGFEVAAGRLHFVSLAQEAE